jgi:hypothetical protein
MKRIAYASVISLGVLASGCVARVYIPPPPPVAVQVGPPPYAVQPAPPPVGVEPGPAPAVAPAPAMPPPVAGAYVPEYYVWDGYEYVGVAGGQYVYWGGGAWLVCDPVILGRFHGWERFHAGWRRGAIRYRGWR